MAYQEMFAERIRNLFLLKNVLTEEQKMMGGIGFMVDNKLCVGIFKNELMARVNPEDVAELLKNDGARQMIHGGRPMKGYLSIAHEFLESDESLEFWIDRCLEFNPLAKSSKKKKK